MPILVGCAGCGTQLRVRDEYIGRPMRCPKCGQLIGTAPVDAVPVVDPALGVQAGPSPLSTAQELASVVPAPRHFQREPEPDDSSISHRGFSPFKPCPRCGGRTAERVVWTAWGSFYGPALLNHVRCLGCGYKYNGRSGRSNFVAAAIFVTVPLVLIAAIIGTLAWWLWYSTGHRVEAPRPAPTTLVAHGHAPAFPGTGEPLTASDP